MNMAHSTTQPNLCVYCFREVIALNRLIYVFLKENCNVSSVKHLGNWITSDLSEQKEINVKKADMIYRVNTVSANLGRATIDIGAPC